MWTLSSECLWFARADTLEDSYEGSTTRAIRNLYAEEIESVVKETDPSFVDQALAFMTQLNQATVRNNAVNCWHMSEYESAAMWKLYVAAGQGVAIRSSIDRLIRCFPEGKASHATDGSRGIVPRGDTSDRDSRGVSNAIAIDFGPIAYADYNEPIVGARPGPRADYFRKRKSFEHEREFRALIFALAVNDEGQVNLNVPVFPDGGVAVPVNLDVLVEAIHVSPGAPPWFREVVQAAIERFGRSYRVVQSRLDEDPIF
jgi:hypothetical protein